MTDNLSKNAILVLATGRSGSSLLMQILGKLGMYFSNNILPTRLENPEGFFEDADIVTVHKKLLSDLRTRPTIPLPDEWLQTSDAGEAKKLLRDIVKARTTDANTIWGFKDPRTCCFLPMWNKIFNEENIIPKYILTVRDPASIARSLRMYSNRDEKITELQWLYRNCEALYQSSADCYILHYEDWFIRGEEIAIELLEYTGMGTFFQGKDVSDALKGIIKENMNRSVYGDYEIQNESVLKLYSALKQCQGSDFNRPMLMQTVKQCRNAMNGFKGWYLQIHELINRDSMLSRQLEHKDSALQKARAAKAEAEKNLEQARTKKQELELKLSELKTSVNQDRIKELETELEKMALQNNRLLTENKEFFKETEFYRRQLTTLSRKPKNLQSTNHGPQKKEKASARTVVQQKNINKLEVQNIELKYSYSFRLGQIIINAFTKPGKNTLLMPFYLGMLVWDMVSGRGRDKVRKALEGLL